MSYFSFVCVPPLGTAGTRPARRFTSSESYMLRRYSDEKR